MVELNLQQFAHPAPIPAQKRKPLGACLVGRGLITKAQLDEALFLQSWQQAPLGEILVAEGWVDRQDVLAALSEQTGLQIADLDSSPPPPDLCRIKPVDFWLAHNVIPWQRIGPILLVATARPDLFPMSAAIWRGPDTPFSPYSPPRTRLTAQSRVYSPSRWPRRPKPAWILTRAADHGPYDPVSDLRPCSWALWLCLRSFL